MALPPSETRRERSRATDRRIATLLDAVEGVAVVAVGGYGREQLSPRSDLDLLIVHRGAGQIEQVVSALLYPLWDEGWKIDHSVRTLGEVREAVVDLKVALGLLDARYITGDSDLAAEVISFGPRYWRENAAKVLPQLRDMTKERWARSGELAYLLEPDLKQARGGLRDLTTMRAIAASWISDIPHQAIDGAEEFLLGVRDALHEVAGRAGDRLTLHHQDRVADILGFANADALMRAIAHHARSVVIAATLTWRAVDRALAPPRRIIGRPRPIRVDPLDDGIGVLYGEVVATTSEQDPLLLVRAAARASERGLALSAPLIERLAPIQSEIVWDEVARDLFITLLAGPGLIEVWELLDHHGVVASWIPEWERVRNLPQRNALHRHTVDRHMIETVRCAAAEVRLVQRPDLLLLAALLHDIGKGEPGDHSEVGASSVIPLLQRLNLPASEITLISHLVRHHLLLPATSTRRDLDDPTTIEAVFQEVAPHGIEGLQLLHALSIADGVATGSAGWSGWKAALVADLVNRVAARMSGAEPPAPPVLTEEEQTLALSGKVSVRVDGHLVTVIAPDRPGLLALVAGVMTVARLDVRSARTLSHGRGAVMRWSVSPVRGEQVDAVNLQRDIADALTGRLDVASKVDARFHHHRPVLVTPPPTVAFSETERAVIVEVRAHDRPGLLHVLSRIFPTLGMEITAAVVSTLGAEACDVFYIDPGHASEQLERLRARLLEALGSW